MWSPSMILRKLILSGLPTDYSSSRTVPAWVCTTVWNPSGADYSRFPQMIAPSDLLLHRRLVSTETAPSGHVHLLHCGLLHGLYMEICSVWDLMGCKGPQFGLSWAAGNFSYVAGAPPAPSSLTLVEYCADYFIFLFYFILLAFLFFPVPDYGGRKKTSSGHEFLTVLYHIHLFFFL